MRSDRDPIDASAVRNLDDIQEDDPGARPSRAGGLVLASLGGSEFRLRETVLISTGLAIGTVLLFVYALKLQIPVWPSF